jgi:hypothetical protein
MNRRTSNFFVICSLILVAGLSLQVISDNMPSGRKNGLLETVFGVPREVIHGALGKGLFSVMIYGSKEDRHRFAKGQSTRFGQMNYSVDSYLKIQKGWSEKKIHEMGFKYGFSQLR